jgi:hypothetical protein
VAATWVGVELALDETDRVVGRALALERRDNDLPLALRKTTQLLDKCLKSFVFMGSPPAHARTPENHPT